jgi:hypothetical protein
MSIVLLFMTGLKSLVVRMRPTGGLAFDPAQRPPSNPSILSKTKSAARLIPGGIERMGQAKNEIHPFAARGRDGGLASTSSTVGLK